MAESYHMTISPETTDKTEAYLDSLLPKIESILGLIKLIIVHEMGSEGNHPHLHCVLTFDSCITLQTLYPRLKKVFGFIPTKPLVVCKPLRTQVDLENVMNYIHSEEGYYEELEWGYLPGEVEELMESGERNDVDNNHSKQLSYSYLEKQINWSTIKTKEELFQKLFELKRKGFDCTAIATNPRKLALWFNFTKNAYNPKLNWYGDHIYKIFNPD